MNANTPLRSIRRTVCAVLCVSLAPSCRARVDTGAPAVAPRLCDERRVTPVPPPERVAWPLTDEQRADLHLAWKSMHPVLELHGRAPLALSHDRPAAGRRLRLWIFEGEGGPANHMIDLVESDDRRELHAFAWFTAESPAVDARRRSGCRTSVCDDRLETCELAPPTCLLDRLPAAPSPAPSPGAPALEAPLVLVEQLDGTGYTIGEYDRLFAGASLDAAAVRELVLRGCPPTGAG